MSLCRRVPLDDDDPITRTREEMMELSDVLEEKAEDVVKDTIVLLDALKLNHDTLIDYQKQISLAKAPCTSHTYTDFTSLIHSCCSLQAANAQLVVVCLALVNIVTHAAALIEMIAVERIVHVVVVAL